MPRVTERVLISQERTSSCTARVYGWVAEWGGLNMEAGEEHPEAEMKAITETKQEVRKRACAFSTATEEALMSSFIL